MRAEDEAPESFARRLQGRRRISRQDLPLANNSRDGFLRQSYCLERGLARNKARQWFERWPKAACMTEVEAWRETGDGRIAFTMRRWPTAD